MSLLQTIQADIVGPTPISDVLRKASILAYRLKNVEFKEWVSHELNGYYGDEPILPDYRIQKSMLFGTFTNMAWRVNNAQIPLDVIPEGSRELVTTLTLRQGVKELESFLESAKQSELGYLQEPLPPALAAYLSNRVYEHMTCVNVWRALTREAIIHVLESTRNRLLTLLLELADQYPDAAILDFNVTEKNPAPDKVAQYVQYYILGGQNLLPIGLNTAISQEVTTMPEVNIGDGNTFGGDFVVAGSIQNSFNKVASADIPGDIKELLQQIIVEGAKVIEVLPTEQAQQTSRDLEALSGEATSKEPRKQWIQLSAEGLAKAAKDVGAVGVPLLSLLDKLLPLLT